MARHKKPDPEIIHQVQGQNRAPWTDEEASRYGEIPAHLCDETPVAAVLAQGKVMPTHDEVLTTNAGEPIVFPPFPVIPPGMKVFEPVSIKTFTCATLAQRVEEARSRLDQAETIADSCYWQGALDALEAFSSGTTMPEVIGLGVKKIA